MPSILIDEELSQEGGPAALLPSLFGVYQEQGYEQGYRRAQADVLASVLLVTEEFLRDEPAGPADARELLHRFGRYLERRLLADAAGEAVYVDGGLGI